MRKMWPEGMLTIAFTKGGKRKYLFLRVLYHLIKMIAHSRCCKNAGRDLTVGATRVSVTKRRVPLTLLIPEAVFHLIRIGEPAGMVLLLLEQCLS